LSAAAVPINGAAAAHDEGDDQDRNSADPTPLAANYRAPHWAGCITKKLFMPDKFSIKKLFGLHEIRPR
jgi:hypothetical protein